MKVIGRVWAQLLQVAEDVREGIRPHHQNQIHAQKEFYGWVQSRIDAMFDKLEEERGNKEYVAYLQG